MKTKEQIFYWVQDVFMSCVNYTQLKNAEKLIILYWQKYKNNSDIMIDCENLENSYYWKCNELK